MVRGRWSLTTSRGNRMVFGSPGTSAGAGSAFGFSASTGEVPLSSAHVILTRSVRTAPRFGKDFAALLRSTILLLPGIGEPACRKRSTIPNPKCLSDCDLHGDSPHSLSLARIGPDHECCVDLAQKGRNRIFCKHFHQKVMRDAIA
jgi:hypothetical protein